MNSVWAVRKNSLHGYIALLTQQIVVSSRPLSASNNLQTFNDHLETLRFINCKSENKPPENIGRQIYKSIRDLVLTFGCESKSFFLHSFVARGRNGRRLPKSSAENAMEAWVHIMRILVTFCEREMMNRHTSVWSSADWAYVGTLCEQEHKNSKKKWQ